jgi:predicted lipase
MVRRGILLRQHRRRQHSRILLLRKLPRRTGSKHDNVLRIRQVSLSQPVKPSQDTSADEHSTNSYGDAAGFLAADNTNQQIVLSFRGSRTLSNWIANFNTVLIASSLCSGCKVHQGFWDDYQTVAATLQSRIDTAQKKYPGYALVITGHSLGGALALLCGTDLHNKGYTLTIVRISTLIACRLLTLG